MKKKVSFSNKIKVYKYDRDLPISIHSKNDFIFKIIKYVTGCLLLLFLLSFLQ